MKVSPVASPQAIQQAPAVDKRAAAIAAFSQPQQSTVQDQNSIGVEELGAISQQSPDDSSQVDDIVEEVVEQQAPKEVSQPEETPESRRWAQLSRQEKALRHKARQQEQTLAAREQALVAREQALAAQGQEDRSNYIQRDRFKVDPLSALAEAGVSYEELTQQLLTQQPKDPRVEATISRLEAKILALEEAGNNSQKSYQEQKAQEYKAAVQQIQRDAAQLIKADPVAYEAISKTGTIKEVVKLIEDTFHKDGVLLSVEEAAQEVENYLVEENYKMATNIDKIKKRMQQAQAASNKQLPTKPQQPQQPQPMKTLTNTSSSTRQLSARERALLAFKGELKP